MNFETENRVFDIEMFSESLNVETNAPQASVQLQPDQFVQVNEKMQKLMLSQLVLKRELFAH